MEIELKRAVLERDEKRTQRKRRKKAEGRGRELCEIAKDRRDLRLACRGRRSIDLVLLGFFLGADLCAFERANVRAPVRVERIQRDSAY